MTSRADEPRGPARTGGSRASDPSGRAGSGRADDHGRQLSKAGQALRAQQPEQARRLLEAALARSPNEPRAQNLLGLAYFKLGRLDEAFRLYEELSRRFPKEASLCVNLGLVQLRQGRTSEAEASFRAALERAPHHRRAHCYLGLVLYRRGELAKAREHFLAGDAHDFARRVEQLSTPAAAPSAGTNLLRDVSAAAEAVLQSAQPFRTVDLDLDGARSRDDQGWRAEVEHHQPAPLADPVEGSSLRRAIRSSVRPPTSTRPGFQLMTGSGELDAAARAAEEVAPEPPELVFSTEAHGRSLLTREEVDALESGLGRTGFVAGPAGRAKLNLEREGAIRADALVLALGRRDLEVHPERPGWWRIRGPTVVLLSVEGLAVALRGLRDAELAPGVLRGYEGDWSVRDAPGGRTRLEGRGTALIAASGVPLVVPLAPDRVVVCARPALLGWSSRVSVVPCVPGAPDERLQARGPGWILVGERGWTGPDR